MNKCKGCGTENCSARELHEKVAEQMPLVAKASRLRREILKRHNIKIPANFGMDSKDKELMDSVVLALVEMERQVKDARTKEKKKPIQRKLRAA